MKLFILALTVTLFASAALSSTELPNVWFAAAAVSLDISPSVLPYTGGMHKVQATIGLQGAGVGEGGWVRLFDEHDNEVTVVAFPVNGVEYSATFPIEVGPEPGSHTYTARKYLTSGVPVEGTCTVAIYQLSITPNDSSIIAGHLSSALHKCSLTATMTPETLTGNVTFELSGGVGTTPATGAELSSITPIALEGGSASVILTSSDIIGDVTISVHYEGDAELKQSAIVHCKRPYFIWAFDQPKLAPGESTTVKVWLKSATEEPIPGNTLTWDIAKIVALDGRTLIYDKYQPFGSKAEYGNISWITPHNITDVTEGLATAIYTAGTGVGGIYFEATDLNIFEP